MQSVDEFTPSTTEPVFGSGLISQTKNSSSTNNDNNDHEKSIPSSEPVVNGQNDTTVNKITSNGTTENVTDNSGAGDSSAVHVNGENEKPIVEKNNVVKPAEKSSQDEPIVPPTEHKPESSTPVDTSMEVSSSVPPPPPVTVEPTTTVNDNVPEVPVATESEPAESKTKVKKKF
jgi:hypothetical protein